MRKLLWVFVLFTAFTFSCCEESFDGFDLTNRVENLENRVSALEEECRKINTNVAALQTIVSALQQNDYITAVTPINEGDKVIGYTISFVKNNPITIYHGKDGQDGENDKDGSDGKDGQDGEDGKDGVDGKDGYTPVIGVKQDTDNIYYWTLDGEWLLDDSGNKIKAVGTDGKDGVDGTDGKDGITPMLKIDNDYWYISYDNGNSWNELGKATGENGPQGEQGIQGPQGEPGPQGNPGQNGDSFFQSVTQDENNVYFTLADGTLITLPKGAALNITFDSEDLVVMATNSTREIGYTVTSSLSGVKVEAIGSGDIKAKAVANNELSGVIKVTTGATIDEYSKVVVLVSNGEKVIMKTLTFEKEEIKVENEAKMITTAEGGEVELLYLSNVECEVIIPDSVDWISIAPATKALEQRSIKLLLEENKGAAREAVVTLQDKDASLKLEYTVSQEPNHDYQLALEREALIAIYNALDGDNWTNNTNWCSDKPVGEWYGVSTITNGEKEGIVVGLELYFNNAKGDIPAVIGDLKNLKSLRIGDHHISTIPKEIGLLTNLTYLDIGGHAVKTTPKEIDNLINLTNLYLWGENVTDFQPTLSPLVNLRSASVFINSGIGFVNGLADLKNLTSLSYLSNMTHFPEEIRNMTQLQYLSFTRSNMQGDNIPTWLSELTNLTYLGLSYCGLTGTIPSELGYLTNLEQLELSGNNLTGTIPASFSNLRNLKQLNINNSKLYGVIPKEIVDMPWFQYRWGEILSGNNFDSSNIEFIGPEFTLTDIKGNIISSNEIYKTNKYTIFLQWRPSEYDCNKYIIQTLIDLYEKYHDMGLEIIAYTGDSMDEISAIKTSWINIIRKEDNYIYISPNDICWSYPMPYMGIPYITVIDTNKKVVYSNLINKTQIDVFLAKQLDNAGSDLYKSSNYSADGEVTTLQTATKGDGIDIVLMGDAYSDRQIADGTYQEDMESIYNNLFTEEPYKSFKDHFNVHYVNVVSKNEGYGAYNETALSGYFGDGTLVGGNDNAVFNYAQKAISAEQMDEAMLIVAMNSDNYAGTCYMYYPDNSAGYGNGVSVSYFPKGADAETFAQLLHHEACGHGFAKLADEYAYEGTEVPSDYVSQIIQEQNNWGWWKNVDFTSDASQVRWKHFLNDSRYQYEGLGTYEGGLTYWSGVWRPTENSIMRYNTGGFNAPSREAIYYRIHKLAYGDEWEYDYEEFVEWDAKNRKTEASATRAPYRIEKPKDFKPTAPPVVINKNWRDVK